MDSEYYLDMAMDCWLKSEKAESRDESEEYYRMARLFSDLYLRSPQ